MPSTRSLSRAGARAPVRTRHVAVLVLPHVHLLDLAGPVQVLFEANAFGADYRLRYCGAAPEVASSQGLVFGRLEPLPDPRELDLVLVPGIDSRTLDALGAVPSAWLREAHGAGVRMASVCTGAFVLAHAGLLDGRQCATHWRLLDVLQRRYPATKGVGDRLFVRDGPFLTSAGVTSGIDMALSLVQEEHGPLMVARVAREMVVYHRRDGEQRQTSVFLEYRTHLSHGVHKVQDWIVANPRERATLPRLARLAAMSPRSLTRAFRQATGITVKDFSQRVRLEVAANLLEDPEARVESVAAHLGFTDARQLRRLWKETYGVSPVRWKATRQQTRSMPRAGPGGRRP
ncbi:helix-turn-helix domain-containing protein [Pyxidicoccus fallax]|uniref:Helix-turn-helix domain-containing protein n=1 Tax=Pyxidicoccus fallax TaxID=394095 RepID=A0A848LMA1_9BACT|nr:helix-turn-helix domain-containing protein [Pyxidicoccus fallax]NMO18908.1 helix-turn-helix domain-containing protein [Pyxidicoccus fallax]NPC79550.1 helix-turn-helix domain-containing protein [Pyxidicoccus fallax]